MYIYNCLFSKTKIFIYLNVINYYKYYIFLQQLKKKRNSEYSQFIFFNELEVQFLTKLDTKLKINVFSQLILVIFVVYKILIIVKT